MSNWLSDPIVRFALQHSFGPLRLLPLIPLVLIEWDAWPSARLSRLGVCCLCFAAPHAAAYLIEMEHDGRLDQMRLAGRRPMNLAGTAMLFVSAPWLLIGLVLTTLAIVAGRPTSEFGETVVDPRSFRTIAGIGAVAGMATMLAAISTTIPFARERIDPRIGIAALSVLALSVCLIGVNVISSSGVSAIAFVFLLVAEAVVIGACMRRLPRRIAHPRIPVASRSQRFRLPPWDWLLRSPGIYRGALLSSSGLVLFTLFAPMGLLVWILRDRFDPRPVESAPLYLPPLFIGLIAVSLICREDAASGRLDMVRQSSRAVAVTAFEMLIGLRAPFVAATIGLMVLAQILFGVDFLNLRLTLVGALLLAPLPLVEGWSRQWPMMYTAPFGIAVVFLTAVSWPAAIAASAVMWIAAARMLFHPDRTVLPGWSGMAAIFALSVMTMLPVDRLAPILVTITVISTFLAVSPVLTVPNARAWTERWGQFLAVLLGVAIVGIWRLGLENGSYLSATALAVWLCAYRIRHWDPSRSLFQSSARIAILVSLAIFMEGLNGSEAEQHRQLTIVTIVLAAAMELLHHASRWTAGLRRQPTLPA